MFECFLWILVFPRIVGVVGRPCNGMAHALRALESFTTKMLRLVPNGLSMLYLTSWWHSFGPIIQLEMFILVNNPHQKKYYVNECCNIESSSSCELVSCTSIVVE
jgi:hypothetical protein